MHEQPFITEIAYIPKSTKRLYHAQIHENEQCCIEHMCAKL